MALPVRSFCVRAHGILSNFLKHGSGSSSLIPVVIKGPPSASAACRLDRAPALSAARLYSSEPQRTNQKVVVVGIPNPFIWCRTRVYYFLIRAYFDQEFNIDDFTEGAKHETKSCFQPDYINDRTRRGWNKMALPVRSFCVRAHGILSNFLKHGSGSSSLIPVVIKGPPSASAACRLGRAPALSAARLYSSEPQRTNQKVVVVGIPNPFIWCRTRVYYFLIRAYFDQEFNIDDFTEGAKHAFARVSNLLSQCKFEALEGLVAKDVLERLQQQCPLLPQTHQQALAADMSDIMYTTPGDVGIYYDDNGAFARVSNLLSQCKFEALEGLVAKDVLERLQQQCPLLPQTHQQALAADMSDIMYTTPGDVGIYYDDNGRKFVSILMRFWYLTSAQLPEETPEGTKVFQVLERLQQQCPLLPQTHQQALAADMSDIMYTTPGDVGIYYDDNGRKFVSILMRFWYLTSAQLPEETPEGTKVFQVAFGEEERGEETKRLLTANYEFQREFTKGVLPDWTITRIEHSKLLD
ncbi:UNVERIFIED_CONTAM: hypothetical protein FKN15_007406 [Acipenser sinensis]